MLQKKARSDSVGPIGLGPMHPPQWSGPVGLRFRVRRFGLGSVLVLPQSVRSGRSIVLILGPIGPDRDRTETEVVQRWNFLDSLHWSLTGRRWDIEVVAGVGQDTVGEGSILDCL